MKKYFIVLYFFLSYIIFCYSFTLAQNIEEKENQPTTKLATFLATKGKLIIKEFYEIGKISGGYDTKMKFNALVLFEPGQENQRIRGVKITITSKERSGEKESTSFLDIDEIESLSESLDYTLNLIGEWKIINKEYTNGDGVASSKFNIKIYKVFN